MSVVINALEKGGFGTYGQSSYDQRANAVIVSAVEGETVGVTVRAPFTEIVDYDVTYSGVESTEPEIDDGELTFSLRNFQGGGRARYDIRFSNGDVRFLNLQIVGSPPRVLANNTDGDYGELP